VLLILYNSQDKPTKQGIYFFPFLFFVEEEMSNEKSPFIELALLAFVTYWWFFVATNVNPLLGNIYTGLTVLAGIILLTEQGWGKISVPLRSQTHNWLTVLVGGLVAYIVLLFGGQLIVNFFENIPITDLLKSLAQTTAPVFAQSKLINFITFVFVVAFIETQAIFVRGFDLVVTFVNKVFKTNLEINTANLFRPAMLLIIFFISFVFMLLHVTAKGIENSAALVLVFVMALISLILVCVYKESRPAIWFHIIANGLGYISAFSIVGLI